LSSIVFSFIIKNIHQPEDTDHVYVIFRTSPRATHMFHAGNLVPAGTTLVTPPSEESADWALISSIAMIQTCAYLYSSNFTPQVK